MSLKRNRISKLKKIRVGITIGDPAGIGPEIVAKAVKNLGNSRLVELVVIGKKSKNVKVGNICALAGRLSIEYIKRGVLLWERGEIDCLVTSPVSKEAISLAGCKFPGHTEYLAYLTSTKDYLMLLVNKYLKFGLATRHLSLKDVPSRLGKKNIYRAIILTAKALKDLFAINNPRIAVLGLNPHASDRGLLGEEESRIILPAVKLAKKRSKYIEGPLSADTGILQLREAKFDAAIAMYHDQALIPLKLTSARSGVNITYGLPFVRTSPLHGTAFDIAGRNKADPSSLITAIKLAIKCALNQRKA